MNKLHGSGHCSQVRDLLPEILWSTYTDGVTKMIGGRGAGVQGPAASRERAIVNARKAR